MGRVIMKAITFTLVATVLVIASLCEGLPEGLTKGLDEVDLGNLDNLQEYLDDATSGVVNDELPTPDKRFMGGVYHLPTYSATSKRFSPDSVKMALIRAFVKQMRSIQGRRMALETRPQQKKRELMKAQEVLRSMNDFEELGGLDGDNQLPISSVTAAAKLGKVGGSWSLIRSPFGVFRLRPQDPAWIDMMEHIGK